MYLSTEFLHGLYDGGHGAGLDDYWNAIVRSPLGAGGVLWCWADAAIARTDMGGKLDTYGNKSADGLVGPKGEKEGSYYSVREIWSPVQIPVETLPADFDGNLPVENRYIFTPLSECAFRWRLLDFSGPLSAKAKTTVRAEGRLNGPAVGPAEFGELTLPLPALILDAEPGSRVGVLRPSNKPVPPGKTDKHFGPKTATWDYPEQGGLYLFHKVPAVGAKFQAAKEKGPQSVPKVLSGPIIGHVQLRVE